MSNTPKVTKGKFNKSGKSARRTSNAATETSVADVAELPRGRNNTVLITNGFKSRVAPPGVEIASIALEGKSAPKDFSDLCAKWEEALHAVDEKSHAIGAGTHGVFTNNVSTQCEQLAPLEDVWLVTNGLGLINAVGKYPLYDLGAYDRSMNGIVEDFDAKVWWKFVCDIAGRSIRDVILQAIEKGRRVVIALSPTAYYMISDDLESIPNDSDTMKRILRHVRIVGQGLSRIVPANLLPCVMSYEAKDIDRLIPGSRSSCSKRAARLFAEASPTPHAPMGDKIGGTDPLKDNMAFAEIQKVKALDPPVEFHLGRAASPSSGRAKVSDEEAVNIIRSHLTKVMPDPVMLSRLIRADGYVMTVSRVQSLLRKAQATAKAK